MSVCLHCGEPAAEGALFCAKCGYTLPQAEASPPPVAAPVPVTPPGAVSVPSAPQVAAVPYRPVAPFPPYGGAQAPVAYVAPVPPGASGPISPPPSAKYCVRCGTLITRVAVYCPVCQQPQA